PAARHLDRGGPCDRGQQQLTMGLATRGWLALRRGDLRAAAPGTRAARAPAPRPPPPPYRGPDNPARLPARADPGGVGLGGGGSTLAVRFRGREGNARGGDSSLRARPAAGRAGTSRGRARGPGGRWPCTDAGAGHLPEFPTLAIGGRARASRARRSGEGSPP